MRRRLSYGAAMVVLAGLAGWSVVQAEPAQSAAKPKAAEHASTSEPRLGDYLGGRIAQLDHDWKTAGRLMRQAWEADRENPELRHDALLLSISGGDFTSAVVIAHVIPAGSSDVPLANMILLVDDLAEARYAAAEARLNTLPAQGVDRYLAPLLMAWNQVGLKNKQAAGASLSTLEGLDGAAELRSLQGAMIAEALGDKADAQARFARMMDGAPSTRAIQVAAHFYERSGAFDKARATIEKLEADGASASLRTEMLARLDAKARPLPSPDPRIGAADAFFEVAASLSTQEQNNLAPLLYTQFSLHLEPNFPQAQLLLAELDRHSGRMEDAIASLLAVDATSEVRTTAVREAMFAIDKAGRPDEALKLAHATVDAHPEDIDLTLSYADLLREKSHFVEAIPVYDAALKRISPTSARRGVALFHRGIAFQQAHQWPRAETDLLAALQLRPDDPGLLNYLAFSWADQGVNLDRARTMLDRAVQLVPDDGAIVDSLGWVMFRAGDYDEAVKQLEKAVHLDADDATVNDHLGDAYWYSGRKIEARAQWERAARLTADKALAEQIRLKLRDGLDQSAPPRHAAAN